MATPSDRPTAFFELRNKALGRLLLPELTLPVQLNLELIPRKGMTPDEFVTHLFATIAKKVPDDAPATEITYDAGDKLRHRHPHRRERPGLVGRPRGLRPSRRYRCWRTTGHPDRAFHYL